VADPAPARVGDRDLVDNEKRYRAALAKKLSASAAELPMALFDAASHYALRVYTRMEYQDLLSAAEFRLKTLRETVPQDWEAHSAGVRTAIADVEAFRKSVRNAYHLEWLACGALEAIRVQAQLWCPREVSANELALAAGNAVLGEKR
jgi:hypothetical protein